MCGFVVDSFSKNILCLTKSTPVTLCYTGYFLIQPECPMYAWKVLMECSTPKVTSANCKMWNNVECPYYLRHAIFGKLSIYLGPQISSVLIKRTSVNHITVITRNGS